jgi:hypothetical protein
MSAAYAYRNRIEKESNSAQPPRARASRTATSGQPTALLLAGPPAIRFRDLQPSSNHTNADTRVGGQPLPGAPRQAPVVVPPGPVPAAPAGLTWSHVTTAHGALWFFCGARPSGFPTTARLRAAGFANPALLAWRITQGADKVAFETPLTGAEVRVRSLRGSAQARDIAIELREGGGPNPPTFVGHLTVRRPHRLIPVSVVDQASGPAWAGCVATCPGYWTRISYRVMDNVSGTIVGATINEVFPGAKTNDQPNDWTLPNATTPFWSNTSGVFVDNWFVCCSAGPPCCLNPAPAPSTPQAGQGVDRIPHEFFVGSSTVGQGCRVQTHVAHRFRGNARHEGIVTPAP